MKLTGILTCIPLILAACSPEQAANTPQARGGLRGETIVFKSNAYPRVLALYLDLGAYRSYEDASEVGEESDIGGDLAPCGEGVTKCVAAANHFIMVPPSTGNDWQFGGYEFQLKPGGSDRDDHIVVVSRDGEESYSYSYSSRCGIGWINFAAGREGGKEVYYPVGRSLFSQSVCTAGPRSDDSAQVEGKMKGLA